MEYAIEQLQDLGLLIKALKKNDEATINSLRKKTGVQDNLETLTATLRFMQIGMAPTYEFAKTMYAQEQEIISKTNENREATKNNYDFIDTDNEWRARSSWEKESERANLDARLKESREDLKDARTYHSATFGDDD